MNAPKTDTESLLSVREVALSVGLSRPRVQQLIECGRLPAVRIGGGWQVSVVDVGRLAGQKGRHGRPYESPEAWALLDRATRGGKVYVPRGTADRDAFWLRNLVRNRARPRLLRVLESLQPMIAGQLVAAGESAAVGFGISGSRRPVDGYIIASDANRMVRAYGARKDQGEDVNLVLRVVDDLDWPFASSTVVSKLVAALDMIDVPVDDRSVDVAVAIIEKYL
jgi:excisionase family DNA binding protein